MQTGKQSQRVPRRITDVGNERGIVLIAALGLIIVLALVGAIAGFTTSTTTQVGGHERLSVTTFYAAEAGTEEARARLRNGDPNQIVDAATTDTTWRTYIGSAEDAAAIGYDADNPLHSRIDSLQTGLKYAVEIRHATVAVGGVDVVEYWGDPDGNGVFARNTVAGSESNQNVYVLTSHASNGASNQIVAIEVARLPPPSSPGPLYVEAPTNILGNSTYLLGADLADPAVEPCGDAPVYGLSTPLLEADSPITMSGSPTLTGPGGAGIAYGVTDINIQAMVDVYKEYADFTYNVESETQTGTASPGPGDGWGDPTIGADLQEPSTCDETKVVYYNTNDTYIRLNGGVTGCGLLLIDGDLDIHGDFYWYGSVLITGNVLYSGGGDKHVTGSLMSEGTADIDVIGGNANNLYCHDAMVSLEADRPLRILSWLQVL